MPKFPKDKLPSYRRHKASGMAVVTLNGRDVYLGPHGTQASKTEYDRVIAEWLANGRCHPASSSTQRGITIAELILVYWKYAEGYYVKNGKPTSEMSLIKLAMRPLRKLYGATLASDFGPLALKAVRQQIVTGGSCRDTANAFTYRIKRMFRWAVENELTPPNVYHGLQAVSGLRLGRCEARESTPVKPVPDKFVDAIRPYVSRQVWALIELQRLTGMRPGEVTVMRGVDLETSERVWHYRPAEHKTQHHGHERVVELGPRAQDILLPFLKPDLQAFLFNPAEAEAERRAQQRQRRKTRVQPSQLNRSKRNPRWQPLEHYTTDSYRRAIARGCDKANEAAQEARKSQGLEIDDERLVPRWHPHQLRHSYATRIRKEHGLEAARVLLGHHSMAVTEVYAEVDRSRMAEIVAKSG
jgi:integrase